MQKKFITGREKGREGGKGGKGRREKRRQEEKKEGRGKKREENKDTKESWILGLYFTFFFEKNFLILDLLS